MKKDSSFFRQGTSESSRISLVEGEPVSGGKISGATEAFFAVVKAGEVFGGVRLQTGKEAEYQYYGSGKNSVLFFKS